MTRRQLEKGEIILATDVLGTMSLPMQTQYVGTPVVDGLRVWRKATCYACETTQLLKFYGTTENHVYLCPTDWEDRANYLEEHAFIVACESCHQFVSTYDIDDDGGCVDCYKEPKPCTLCDEPRAEGMRHCVKHEVYMREKYPLGSPVIIGHGATTVGKEYVISGIALGLKAREDQLIAQLGLPPSETERTEPNWSMNYLMPEAIQQERADMPLLRIPAHKIKDDLERARRLVEEIRADPNNGKVLPQGYQLEFMAMCDSCEKTSFADKMTDNLCPGCFDRSMHEEAEEPKVWAVEYMMDDDVLSEPTARERVGEVCLEVGADYKERWEACGKKYLQYRRNPQSECGSGIEHIKGIGISAPKPLVMGPDLSGSEFEMSPEEIREWRKKND